MLPLNRKAPSITCRFDIEHANSKKNGENRKQKKVDQQQKKKFKTTKEMFLLVKNLSFKQREQHEASTKTETTAV
jgi:hypothetical protein